MRDSKRNRVYDAEAGVVRVAVHDDGPGFAPDVLAALRDAQPRLDAAGRVAGLGLRLIRSIAEAVGGRVEITSTPEAGATVALVLPTATRAVRVLPVVAA